MLRFSQRCIQFTFGFVCTLLILSIYHDMYNMQKQIRLTYSYIQDFTMQSVKKEERPWYLTNGTRWPSPAKIDSTTGRRETKLWPHEDTESDRLINQLMFVPPETGRTLPVKKVLMWPDIISWETIHPKGGTELFKTCPVNNCIAVTDKNEYLKADAILFVNHFFNPGNQKPSNQVWIQYIMESPLRTEVFDRQDGINWTATYMQSSDIRRPYGTWIYYDESQTEWKGPPRNFAVGKTKKVAWFVSNCNAYNNRRYYAEELSKYIQVDIYGGCGTLQCGSRFTKGHTCFKLLEKDYKFYLAFENSNCREYITEKYFENGLNHNVIPVVMGAPKEDYELVGPKNSFIHVEDFDSPKHLAEYLHKLNQDDDLFNSYFKWKGMGEVIPGYFHCRLCAMLHDDYPIKYYPRFDDWWRKPGHCINGTWREFRKKLGGTLPKV